MIKDALFLKVNDIVHSPTSTIHLLFLEPGENGNDDMFIRGCADEALSKCTNELVHIIL